MKSNPLNFKHITSDRNLRQLLQGLLDLDSDKRICNFQQIKNCSWLGDIDWKKIQEKSYTVPFFV